MTDDIGKHPEEFIFDTTEELLGFLREHSDDIESVVVPVQDAIEIRGPNGERHVTRGIGAWIKLRAGNSFMLSRDDAAMLINDGMLQQLKIECALDPRKK